MPPEVQNCGTDQHPLWVSSNVNRITDEKVETTLNALRRAKASGIKIQLEDDDSIEKCSS
jgi:hypothetical protein